MQLLSVKKVEADVSNLSYASATPATKTFHDSTNIDYTWSIFSQLSLERVRSTIPLLSELIRSIRKNVYL